MQFHGFYCFYLFSSDCAVSFGYFNFFFFLPLLTWLRAMVLLFYFIFVLLFVQFDKTANDRTTWRHNTKSIKQKLIKMWAINICRIKHVDFLIGFAIHKRFMNVSCCCFFNWYFCFICANLSLVTYPHRRIGKLLWNKLYDLNTLFERMAKSELYFIREYQIPSI